MPVLKINSWKQFDKVKTTAKIPESDNQLWEHPGIVLTLQLTQGRRIDRRKKKNRRKIQTSFHKQNVTNKPFHELIFKI